MAIGLIEQSFFPTEGSKSFPTKEKLKIEATGIVDEKSARENIFLKGPVSGLLNFDNSTIITETFKDYEIIKTNIKVEYFLNNILVTNLKDKTSADKSIITIEPYSALSEFTEYKLYVNGVNETTSSGLSELRHGFVLDNGEVTEKIKVFGKPNILEDKVLNVKFVTEGVIGSAKYLVWFDDEAQPAPTRKNLFTSSGRWKDLGNGLSIKFVSGDFISGETYTVNCYAPNYLENSYVLNFSTSSDTLTISPEKPSVSALPMNIGEVEAIEEGFRVVSMSPEINSVNISKDLKQVVITFNKELDPTSISKAIKITTQPVEGSFNGANEEIRLPRIVSASGNKLILEL